MTYFAYVGFISTDGTCLMLSVYQKQPLFKLEGFKDDVLMIPSFPTILLIKQLICQKLCVSLVFFLLPPNRAIAGEQTFTWSMVLETGKWESIT